MMQKNKTLIIAVIMIIILITAGYAYYRWMPKELAEEEEKEGEITPPEATGKVSDLIDALEKEIQDELDVVYEGDEDGNLILSDTEEIDDFGRSADDAGL